jgi:hypothetical protein
MANTLAFPVTARLFVGPRVWVGLVMVVAFMAVHLISVSRNSSA